jgi:hypothetical protein
MPISFVPDCIVLPTHWYFLGGAVCLGRHVVRSGSTLLSVAVPPTSGGWLFSTHNTLCRFVARVLLCLAGLGFCPNRSTTCSGKWLFMAPACKCEPQHLVKYNIFVRPVPVAPRRALLVHKRHPHSDSVWC